MAIEQRQRLIDWTNERTNAWKSISK